MEYVCKTKCYVKGPDGRLHLFRPGQVVELDGPSIHFVVVEDHTLNFGKATEDELMGVKWEFMDAKAFVKTQYNVTLKRGRKSEVVAQILDARFRSLQPADTDHTR